MQERKNPKNFSARRTYFSIYCMKGEEEVSHMKSKTFILLVAMICLILAMLAACA